MADAKIKVKLVRSPICTPEKHKQVVRGLGLRKLNQVVEWTDTPAVRGMVNKVPHLVEIVSESRPHGLAGKWEIKHAKSGL
jgi:large subunit ribosomal protein L30